MGIVEFLEARIAEDEAIARTAAESDPGDKSHLERGKAGAAWTARNGMVEGAEEDLWDCEGSRTLQTTPEIAAHMARHDPARVLAECAAKRAVIALYRPGDLESSDRGAYFYAEGAGDAVKALAAVYKDHPDYRQEWELG